MSLYVQGPVACVQEKWGCLGGWLAPLYIQGLAPCAQDALEGSVAWLMSLYVQGPVACVQEKWGCLGGWLSPLCIQGLAPCAQDALECLNAGIQELKLQLIARSNATKDTECPLFCGAKNRSRFIDMFVKIRPSTRGGGPKKAGSLRR